ncbi:hypothetical protein BDZ45DRAFT_683703 [Acephala macrosclerotiorum]|nr:hypothetical protein BDZ45DRAFT_683703 [Acephala macrosclerotiorum]
MVGETKQPLYRQDFAKIAVKLNAKFAGVKVNKGDELASGVQRGPIVTGATKRRVRRFAQDNWIIPERSVPAIQDYVTRSIRVEYNEICQRLVGRIDEMYGLPRSGESKKRKVDDVNEEESMVGAIGGISGNGTFGSMMESGHDNVPGLGGYPGNGQIQGYQNITPHQNVWVPGPPYIPGNFYWL